VYVLPDIDVWLVKNQQLTSCDGQLKQHWQELEPKDRALIKREIREKDEPVYDNRGLGNPSIDRPHWTKEAIAEIITAPIEALFCL